jgi:molybdopterin/thiamine biosynthesis adenylyltransferase
MDDRYSRNTPALTLEECALLGEKQVCVVGCGGLGGYNIELLSRIGVGALTVVDGDVFEVSNLNRQLLCDDGSIGRKKALVAAERVKIINSVVNVTAAPELFTEDSASRLLRGCHLAVDALDNAAGRLVLADACAAAGIFLIHGAISGFFAQVSVIAHGSGVMEKLYPRRFFKAPQKGNLGFAAAMCASIQSAEAIKLLCGRQSALLGKLLLIDMRTMGFTTLDVK